MFKKEHVKQALNAIYWNNVKSYYEGKQGAVNGYIPGIGIDLACPQSEEVWTGITYALASLMIMEVWLFFLYQQFCLIIMHSSRCNWLKTG